MRVLIVILAVGGCRQDSREPSPAVLAEARQQLLERGRADQAVREGFGVGGVLDTTQLLAMQHTDSANTAWLRSYVERWGWPRADQVGRDNVQSAFLIVQHAVQDTAFMHAMLPAIVQAHERGDIDGGAVAMLTDRIEVKAGRPQVYGTQLSLKDGQWVLDPIADSAGVDDRRRRMRLPPWPSTCGSPIRCFGRSRPPPPPGDTMPADTHPPLGASVRDRAPAALPRRRRRGLPDLRPLGRGLFQLSGRDPHAPQPLWFVVTSVVYGMVFAALGGFVAARVAPARGLRHAAGVAILLALGASVSLLASSGDDATWSQWTALALMAPSAYVGGRFAARGPRRG